MCVQFQHSGTVHTFMTDVDWLDDFFQPFCLKTVRQKNQQMYVSCTRTPCEYWHPPECQLFQNTCLFPYYKVDEQPNKRPKKGYFPKGKESEDKGALAIAKSVSQLGCVSEDSDALVSQGAKEFRWNPMQKVLHAIQRVPFAKSTLRHASIREKKGPSVGTIQVKPRHQRTSLRDKNLRVGPTKRLQDSSDVPEVRRGILPKTCTSSKQKTRLHSIFPRWNGYSWLRQHKS